MCKLFFVPSNTPAFNWFSYLWRSDRLSYVLVTTDRFWTEIQALLDLSFPLSLLLSSLLASADPCFPCSVSSFSVVGCELCRVRRDRALPAAALFWNQKKKKKSREREKGDVELTCSMTEHFQGFIPSKAHGSRFNKTTFFGGGMRESWRLVSSRSISRAMCWTVETSLKIREVPETRPEEPRTCEEGGRSLRLVSSVDFSRRLRGLPLV